MIITYDTVMMKQMEAACQSANEELEKARRLVLEISSHSDWTCKEKNAIDDLMRECKKRIKEIFEQEQGFLNAVKQVAEELADAEKNVSGLFGGVEGLLGKILAVPVKTAVVVGGGLLASIFGGSAANTGTGGAQHGGGGISAGTDWASSVKETFGDVLGAVREAAEKVTETHKQELLSRYDAKFEGGQLIWNQEGQPPQELIAALGGVSFINNRTEMDMIVTWPDGTSQVFPSTEKPDYLQQVFDAMVSSIDIVPCRSLEI